MILKYVICQLQVFTKNVSAKGFDLSFAAKKRNKYKKLFLITSMTFKHLFVDNIRIGSECFALNFNF